MSGIGTPGAPGSEPLRLRLGGALFRARGWVPVPLALGLALAARPPGWLALPGLLLTLSGLGLRLWAVSAIGPGSRRRDDAVGPLASEGPYKYSRNPLYLGNLILWAALAAFSGHLLAIPAVLLPLWIHYQLIIRWEEARLGATLGEPYRAWAARTSRWLPRPGGVGERPEPPSRAALRVAWRSERSTRLACLALTALVLGAGLLRDAGPR